MYASTFMTIHHHCITTTLARVGNALLHYFFFLSVSSRRFDPLVNVPPRKRPRIPRVPQVGSALAPPHAVSLLAATGRRRVRRRTTGQQLSSISASACHVMNPREMFSPAHTGSFAAATCLRAIQMQAVRTSSAARVHEYEWPISCRPTSLPLEENGPRPRARTWPIASPGRR